MDYTKLIARTLRLTQFNNNNLKQPQNCFRPLESDNKITQGRLFVVYKI